MKNLRGHVAMLTADSIWGAMAPVAKIVLATGVVTPLMVANFRMAGAAVLFWVASLFTRKEHVTTRDKLLLAGAGMLGVVFNQGGYIFGVSLTSPGEASIVTTTMPMWVMFLGAIVLKQRPGKGALLGLALGATGALILILSGMTTSAVNKGDNPVLGDMLVLCAQFSYALYLTLYKDFISKYSVVTLMKWMFTFAALSVGICSIPSFISADWTSITASQWLGATYIVVMGTFVAYICIMIGQKHLTPAVVGMYNYVQPVVACMLGVILGLDRFTPVKILAVILIFTGVYLVTVNRSITMRTPSRSTIAEK